MKDLTPGLTLSRHSGGLLIEQTDTLFGGGVAESAGDKGAFHAACPLTVRKVSKT